MHRHTLALHALMKATHLLGLALAERLRHYRDSGDPMLDRFAALQEQVLHVEFLREAIDIHGSRWDKLPERQRPHYAAEARFRILRLRNLLALSRRTIQRVRREKPIRPPTPPVSAERQRAVCARYPNHVWMLDLTEIPGFLRLFSFKLAVVLDVFSRAPLAARVFYQEPSGRDIAMLFARTARRVGRPRHSVSDQGAQFTSGSFRKALVRLGVKHRYGAIGTTGSIAIIERFFRTLKAIASVRLRPPLLRRDLESRLALAFLYYLWLRPHQGLGGATPAELRLGLWSGRAAVPPPRGAPGQAVDVTLDVEIRHLDLDKHLPYLVRKAA